MNVLSLFDGMSCGRIALERAGISVTAYYASEIDKWAIKVSEKNWPDIIHLGDVNEWRQWDIDWSSIDLVTGGSPCQSFSASGSKKSFDDERGKLFFVLVDILNHVKTHNQKVKWLVENVRMKKEDRDVFTEYLGVPSLTIDSRWYTPLSRPRLYWTNMWLNVTMPDIEALQNGEEPWCELHQDWWASCDCIGPTEDNVQYEEIEGELKAWRYHYGEHTLKDVLEEPREDMPWLSERAIERLVTIEKRASKKGYGWKGCILTEEDIFLNLDASFYKGPDGKRGVISQNGRLRMPTPLECERLQGVPDGYTEGVSNTQRYRMIGNAWTVPVIAHILKGIEE